MADPPTRRTAHAFGLRLDGRNRQRYGAPRLTSDHVHPAGPQVVDAEATGVNERPLTPPGVPS
jgi:hypothetical protein